MKIPVFITPKFFELYNKVRDGLRGHSNTVMRGMTFPGFVLIDSDDEKLRKHEAKHAEDMLKEWVIIYFAKYYYYNWTIGYNKNPYEVSAREAENK